MGRGAGATVSGCLYLFDDTAACPARPERTRRAYMRASAPRAVSLYAVVPLRQRSAERGNQLLVQVIEGGEERRKRALCVTEGFLVRSS